MNMDLTRRDFLKASSALAGAMGVVSTGLVGLEEAFGAEGASPPVVWLQGQSCTGCSISLLNTIYYATIDQLLTTTLDVDFHPQLMAAVGSQAIAAAQTASNTSGGFILVVEGAIPTDAKGAYCTVWPGMTALNAVKTLGAKASMILAVGTCASFGGIPKGKPNPTGASPVSALKLGKPLVNIAGCPAHPDWVVGTIAYILKYGKLPTLDSSLRPTDYFSATVHSQCPRAATAATNSASQIGQSGCLRPTGCRGPETYADCPIRRWNSGAASTAGANWCIGASVPCHGCTGATFPDGESPFFAVSKTTSTGTTNNAAVCAQCHSDGRSGALPAGHIPI
jgi:hydrogenase small subunit